MNPRLTASAAFATIAASLALAPLVSGAGWFWAGVGAVIMAAAVGLASRIRAAPAPICLLASLAGEFLYLNAAFAGAQSRAGLVPTGESLHQLAVLAGRSTAEMAKYAPPVPASHGVSLAAATGIGLVAVLTDLLAVRLRRPALAGLPLLVLFCVPLTTNATSNWVETTVVFFLGMTGFLALLSSDGRQRLRLWGHVVRPPASDPAPRRPDTRPLGAAGRRIGFAAVVLALFLPLLVPGLRHHPLFGGGGSGRGSSAPLSLPEPLVQLNRELHAPRPQLVLTYHTADQTPPYFQVYVLGRLGVDSWSLASPRNTALLGGGPLPAAPGLGPGTHRITIRESVRLGSTLSNGPTTLSYLPLPYAPRTVQVSGDWRVDRTSLSVYTAGAKLAGLRYAVTSADVDPWPQQLARAGLPPAAETAYLAVPQELDRPALLRLAAKVTAGAATAYDKALALQDWFTQPGNFAYTLNAPEPRTPGALIRFLTQTKRGYCQQFAFGMAVLARLLGIPSRIVVGYTQGTPVGNGTWRVTTSDAHAWPELYFQGAGWIRFEPTPSGSPGHAGQATATPPAYTFDTPHAKPRGHQRAHRSSGPIGPAATARPTSGGILPKLNRLSGAQAGAARRTTARFPAVPLLLALAAALLGTPAAARLVRRRLRWLRATTDAGQAHAAWQELRCDLSDYRIMSRPSETPRALTRRLAAELRLGPAQREALARIARAEERARYAASPERCGDLRADVATVRRALARASRFPDRCAAAAAPASVLLPVRAAVSNALDMFGWIDLLGAALRSRAPRRRGTSAASWRA